VHGTSDPFGAIAEIEAARALIPERTGLLTVEAGHDLGRERAGSGRPALAGRIVSAFLALVG